jgi:hypothetical protein
LEIKDIPGTAAGSRRKGNFHSIDRQQFRNTNNITEIEGGNPGSLKKSIITKRVVNPLNPNYVLPGSSELGTKFENDPFAQFKGSSMDPKFVEIKKREE